MDINRAQWVVAPAEFASPVIMRTLHVTQPAAAMLHISALGFFTVFVNGKRVGDAYFRPSNSLFHERDHSSLLYPISDTFTYRCYYSVYDISAYLLDGENVLQIALGDGWYRQRERIAEGNMCFGDVLGTVYALSITDAAGEREIYSDGSEQCRSSATVYSQLFYGETYDARIDSQQTYTYASVTVKRLPQTELSPEITVPDRIIRRVKPTLLFAQNGRKIYDVGENISGFVTLSSCAAWGEQVAVRFSENISGNALDFETTGASHKSPDGKPQIMEDIFIGDGQAHVFEPQFVWHAFRYFEIEGDGEALTVAVVHSDTPPRATFTSASKELNWLFDAYVRTQLNNMHAGVPSDCPHRERLGYTGDGQVCAPAAMTLLDCRSFYKKWIRDIFDSQDQKTGHVNHTAPFAGGGGGPGGWGCAAVIVPYYYHVFFGDDDFLAENYPHMKKWIAYLTAHSENGLVVREEDGGWCLGDWCTLEKTVIPEPLVNTCYYIRSLLMMEELADILGNGTDTAAFASLRTQAQAAVTAAYFDNATGSFVEGVQGADAFALFADLGDDRTFRNLVQKYRALGHFDTGFLCTNILCGLLFERGETDLAFALLTGHDKGSFGYMMDHGATTLWEDWHGCHSHDHPMFGACARYLITAILGIRTGKRETVIAPRLPEKLAYAKGSIMLPQGCLSVEWHREADGIAFDILLPENFCCRFVLGDTVMLLDRKVNSFKLP